MGNLFFFIEIFTICIIFLALCLLLLGKESREQKLMVYFIAGSLVQNCGYLFEYISPTMDAAVIATKMEYLGSVFIPVLYCWFICFYCYEIVPKRLLQAVAAIDFIVLAAVFTCDLHPFYYRSLDWQTAVDGHHYLSITYGPLYLVFMLCSCILPYSLSFITLIRATISKPQQAASRKYMMVLILSAMPILALLSYAMKLTYIYDLTPAVLGIVLSLVVILVWSRKIYDFRSLASGIVLNSMGDGVITLDDQKQIVNFNQAAGLIFPQLDEKSIGAAFFSVIDDLPEDILEQNKNEFCLGDRFFESHVKTLTEGGSQVQGYVILLLDITETRNYIDEIKRVREQAERANTAKSEFLANMSHEIRTPMNAIVGLSDIIMEESRGRKVYNYANDIKSASHSLLTIINDILDLSKVEAGKMELVLTDYYIKGLVGGVTSIMDINASLHGLLLKCEYNTDIPCQYHGDEGRIRQILINLLNNAIKFTKEGYVQLSVNGEPGEDGIENLIFCIEDTGCGIKPEDLDSIFEDFKQVDAKRNRTVEGTGLGLSITKHLVALMGGSIKVYSTYGIGTVFTVTIPQKIVDSRSLLEVPLVPVEQKEDNRFFTVREGYKILVVDDNVVNRRVAIGFLKRYGFEISEAESGPDAIEQVKNTLFDIIFMDHMMPEMDGVEAVRIIRSECGENGTKPIIIALTANAMEGVRNLFLQNGFQDFLAKPLYRKPLNEMLMKWIPDKDKTFVEEDEAEKKPGSDMDVPDIMIPGIDAEEALLHHPGDVPEYIELLQLYLAEGSRKLKTLKDLMEKGDYKSYGIEVHGLKSASANVGAMVLSEQAKAHEYAVRDGDEEFVQRHFPDLYADYETLLGQIQSFLDRTVAKKETQDDITLPPIDRDALLAGIREALESIEDFRSQDADKKLSELLTFRLDDDVKDAIEETRQLLKLYEDDEAEETLKTLMEGLES